MGLNLNELSSLAGGIHQGIGDVQQRRIAANQEARDQDEHSIKMRQQERTDRYREELAKFQGAMNPSNTSQTAPQQGQALPAPGQASPPPGTTSPAAPAGGQALPAGGQGAPSDGMGPPTALAGPGGGIGAPGGAPVRRGDTLNNLESEALQRALIAGGIEEFKSARDAFRMARRGQMVQWGFAAAQAMDANKDAGAAAKQLNTIMDIMPTDTGTKWVAKEGELFMERGGKLQGPFKAQDVRAYTRQYIMDDDNYESLTKITQEDRKQAEVERAALVEEAQGQQRANAYDRYVSVAEAQQALVKKFRERGMQVDEMNALSNMLRAKAANTRALASIDEALMNGWSNSEIIRIYSDADEWQLNDFDADRHIQDWMNENKTEWALHRADVANTMLRNPPGTIGRDEASLLSQYVRYSNAENATEEQLTQLAQKAGIGGWGRDEDTGQIVAVINGRQVNLDPGLASAAGKFLRPAGGGDKEQTETSALPTNPNDVGPPAGSPYGDDVGGRAAGRRLTPEQEAAGFKLDPIYGIVDAQGYPVAAALPTAQTQNAPGKPLLEQWLGS